jgi:MFS family permease
MQALLSVFLGYLAYYIVRNNFTLSTPYLKEQLDLSATQIGLLSSCMLIAYGISKGVMSSLADKASPKVFMACGLVLCAIVNVGLGFSTAFWIFAALVVLNGLFQGMGVGPSFITIANWFPRRERGRVGRSGTFPITSAAGLSPRSSAPHLRFSVPSTGRAPATLSRPAWRWCSPSAYWRWVKVRRARKVCLRWKR